MELFLLKLLDGALGTAKSIFFSKHKYLLASLIAACGTFFYLTMMVKLVKVNSSMGMFLVCLATFLGTYVPMAISKRVEKDKVFVYNITPDSNETGKAFADEARENNLPILTYKGYTETLEPILCSKIFAVTKEQSKMVEDMIPKEFKYHVIETKNSIVA